MSETLTVIKGVILGNFGVGKTSLKESYASGNFNENPMSTIGIDFVIKKITTADGETIKQQIWEIEGGYKFWELASKYVF